MPRGGGRLKLTIWADGGLATPPVPTLPLPIVPDLPAQPIPRPPLQSVSPNKRRFDTVEDTAAAERFPAKRKRPGPPPKQGFGQARKLHKPPPTKRPRYHNYTREEKLKVINYIANRNTWVADLRPHQHPVREGLQ